MRRDEESDQDVLRLTDGIGILFDRHGKAVFRAACALLGNVDEAQDVLQDTFVVAWRKRSHIRTIDSSALPWLLATCRNVALNHARAQRRRRTETVDPHSFEFERQTPSAFPAFDAVADAVSDLSLPDQDIVRLVLVDGLSYDEAAQQLGLVPATARKRLQRARARLRTHLAVAPADTNGPIS